MAQCFSANASAAALKYIKSEYDKATSEKGTAAKRAFWQIREASAVERIEEAIKQAGMPQNFPACAQASGDYV